MQCDIPYYPSVRCSVRSRELHRGRRVLRQLDGDDRDGLVLRLPPVLHPRRLRPLHLREQEEGGRVGRGVRAAVQHEGPLLGGVPERPLLLLDLPLERGVVHEVQVADSLAAAAAAPLHDREAQVPRQLCEYPALAQDLAPRLAHPGSRPTVLITDVCYLPDKRTAWSIIPNQLHRKCAPPRV